MNVQKQASMKAKFAVFGFTGFAVTLLSIVAWAQKGDLTHQHPGAPAASVDFGVVATAPIGPPACLQTGAIGGPTDPCSYLLHRGFFSALVGANFTVEYDSRLTPMLEQSRATKKQGKQR
jgi:hypothetical protein